MLLLILLAAASPQAGVALSPEVRTAMEQRAATGDGPFFAKIVELVEQDDASAIEFMGEALLFGGFGVARDPGKACGLFARAAERRADSAHNLARCYEKGDGLAADGAKARQWYAKAAQLGYPKSSCALGNLMIAGTGGPMDVSGGVARCRAAAEAGDPDAQTDLGNALLVGTSGVKDAVEARKWYALAAAQGQANAQFVLGQIYAKGDGTPVDRDAAIAWWKRAYEGGRKDAPALIVGALFKRVVVERDGKETVDRTHLPETLVWLERAATEDPNPARRAEFAKILRDLRG